jgi:hypothetical protein
MAHKPTRPRSHSAFRHRSQIPLPAVDAVAQRLRDVLSPSLLAPRPLPRRDPRQPERLIRMRQRLLTRPVIVAITVRWVWRRVPSIAAGPKRWAHAGLLGIAPRQVSPQALSNRLDVLPAAVLGQRWEEVCARLQPHAPPTLPHPRWAPLREHCPRLAIVDGSTLEALRKKPQVLREHAGVGLGGTMRVLVEALSHRPLWPLYTDAAAAPDKRCVAEILAALPVGGLLVFDLGFFSFLGCDDGTASARFCVTRMREKTA